MLNELREDPLTGRWVIIAKSRSKRFHEIAQPKSKIKFPPHYHCPFCPGMEKGSREVLRMDFDHNHAKDMGWGVRSILNKAPYFEAPSEEESGVITEGVIFKYRVPKGQAEVLIETPYHNEDLIFMHLDQLEKVIEAYKLRYIDLAKTWNEISIFRNDGFFAGQTLNHPHSQITATEEKNPEFVEEEKRVEKFYRDYGECLLGHMEKVERLRKKRVVLENKNFVAICPWASVKPYEIMIIPKKHSPNISDLTDEEIKSFAKILREVLRKVYVAFNDPSYNYFVRNYDSKNSIGKSGHWYLKIIYHLTVPGGYEASSGAFVNVTPPEEAAEYLRKIKTTSHDWKIKRKKC